MSEVKSGWPGREGPVAMKLFGAWEVESGKTPSNAIPRLCSLTVARLVILKSMASDVTSCMIAVKMLGSKRTLRSNEINVVNNKSGESSNSVELDLTFALQYPHFLKKNGNQLQILLQRRKRYKNRAILGYKTLAGGVINMADVLQRSQNMCKELDLRENSKDLRKSDVVARIVMSSLKSQPVDHEVNSSRGLKPILNESADLDSDEELDEFSPSDGSDSEAGDDLAANGSRVKYHRKRRGKKSNSLGTGSLETPNAHQRNLKQKFIALLKKFKIPDSEASDSEEQAALENLASTDLGNIEDIFEFEDSDVDSQPEMDDDFSVSSTPRPGLKPFFSSKTTLVEENENVGVKRQGSGQSSDDFPVSSSPKPSLRPFFSSSKSTLASQDVATENNRVENEQQDSSGTDHTPDTSDTSLKNPFAEGEDHKKKGGKESVKDKKGNRSGKESKPNSGSKERKVKDVKETISRLLRK